MIDIRNYAKMINAELYSEFVDKCLCLNCPNNNKIVRNNETIKRIVSCSHFRNKPKSYISNCQDWNRLEVIK